MAPQVVYRDEMVRGIAGQFYDSGPRDVISALNDDPRAAQVVEFEVADTETSGDLTLNSVEFAVEGEADQDAVAEALADAINESSLLSGSVVAESATDTVTVTARVGGVGFTYADGTNTTATETQANAQADAIPFGHALVLDGQGDDGELLCKLIDSDTDPQGIAVYTASYEKPRPDSLSDDPGSEYPPNSAVNLLRKGRVRVSVEEDVEVGDDVYVRHTADGDLDDVGGFATASGTGLREVTNCKWHKGSQDGVAVLQCDFL